ncbi:hypothetical protein EJV47_14615 [Hymenobacter gummosus]|uniref:Lipoprotein n=1 Tax=Hymenobacter gummosus TaxID=1776032 RepID=A0A431U145_9BACT|nr:hypothetical protein [Hymenobacter gummosus]RTQ48830.1 hypothetical protein EJV47_14615 [Hymenobacter gummosus]
MEINRKIIFIALFTLISCQNRRVLLDLRENIKSKECDVGDLLEYPKRYDSLYVEISGRINDGYENTSFCQQWPGNDECVWVDISSVGYMINNYSHLSIDGENVKIIGRFLDKPSGHLGRYKGEITDIKYIQIN